MRHIRILLLIMWDTYAVVNMVTSDMAEVCLRSNDQESCASEANENWQNRYAIRPDGWTLISYTPYNSMQSDNTTPTSFETTQDDSSEIFDEESEDDIYGYEEGEDVEENIEEEGYEDTEDEENEDDGDEEDGEYDDECTIDGIAENRRCHVLPSQYSYQNFMTSMIQRNSLVNLPARTQLLQLCNQSEPITFQEAIPLPLMSRAKKVSEGVIGEIFRICNIMLKVIPIEGNFTVNDEPQKTYEEVLSELIINKEVSGLKYSHTSMATNFCGLKGAALVQGRYPAKLLKEWDRYHKREKSFKERPDMFPASQLFMLYEFEKCGVDLDVYEYESFYQARSMLRQVAYSLAVAEERLQFEHRDLHWGNLLVKTTDKEYMTYILEGNSYTVATLGVETSIIDFTMSRITLGNKVIYADLGKDEEIFEGKDDYQFDIYRIMREKNRNNWQAFNPYSNVLWLHYLADKFLTTIEFPIGTGIRYQNFVSQFIQFQESMTDYESAHEMAINSVFLNS